MDNLSQKQWYTIKERIGICIKEGCGKRYDLNIPEHRDHETLRPFAMWYCPEHRVTGKYFEPIIEKR